MLLYDRIRLVDCCLLSYRSAVFVVVVVFVLLLYVPSIIIIIISIIIGIIINVIPSILFNCDLSLPRNIFLLSPVVLYDRGINTSFDLNAATRSSIVGLINSTPVLLLLLRIVESILNDTRPHLFRRPSALSHVSAIFLLIGTILDQ